MEEWEVRRSLPENFSCLFLLLLIRFSCVCGAQKTRPFDRYNEQLNSASKAPKELIIRKVSVKTVSMSQTVAQQWTRRLGWGGAGAVTEFLNFLVLGQGDQQDRTGSLNDEVFWA